MIRTEPWLKRQAAISAARKIATSTLKLEYRGESIQHYFIGRCGTSTLQDIAWELRLVSLPHVRCLLLAGGRAFVVASVERMSNRPAKTVALTDATIVAQIIAKLIAALGVLGKPRPLRTVNSSWHHDFGYRTLSARSRWSDIGQFLEASISRRQAPDNA